jgi:putative transposase
VSNACSRMLPRQSARCLTQAPLHQQRREMPERPPRLERVFQRYDPPLYFVTFNTAKRSKFLANTAVHQAFIRFAREAEKRNNAVGRYVLMPDHVHLFVCAGGEFVLSQWVRMLKRVLSTAIDAPSPHWQEGFFDHLVGKSESYSQKWEYVRQTPVRAGVGCRCGRLAIPRRDRPCRSASVEAFLPNAWHCVSPHLACRCLTQAPLHQPKLRASLRAATCLRAARGTPADAVFRRASTRRTSPGRRRPDSPSESAALSMA